MFVGAAAAQWVSHLLVPAETAMPMALIMLGAALACGVANLGLIGLPRAPR
jgi:hypothetical protein